MDAFSKSPWRGESAVEPLFRANDPALEVAAFALRSEFEVLGAAPGRNSRQWLGRDAVPLLDPATSTRAIRWRTTLPGVNGGELQVAVQPFPKPGDDPTEFDPCETEGVFYSKSFQAAASGWTDVGEINFGQLLAANPDGQRIVSDAVALKLELGMPLYVRIVPAVNGRLLCDPRQAGVPPEVLLANIIPFVLPAEDQGPAIIVKHVDYHPPDMDRYHPVWGVVERCFRVIKQHAPVGIPPFTATTWDLYLSLKGLAGNVGDQFCIVENSGGDDGWFESLTSSVTSFVSKFVDGIGALVDFAANTWDSIQDSVVDGVASGIDAVGIVDCDALCREALRTGLEIALASMGVPPSLPNFEKLQQMGLDYAAQQLAEQTGVPGPIADLATQKAKQFVDSAMSEMRDRYSVHGMPDWLVPDVRFDPAYIILPLWGTGQALPSNPRLIRDPDSVFSGGVTVLPRRLPAPADAPLPVPIVLMPNLAGLGEPKPSYTDYGKAVWFKKEWIAHRFNNGCYRLFVIGLVPGHVLPLVNLMFSPETLAPCSK